MHAMNHPAASRPYDGRGAMNVVPNVDGAVHAPSVLDGEGRPLPRKRRPFHGARPAGPNAHVAMHGRESGETDHLPAPLTPADCDLRGMPFMPMDLVRLFDSDLYALSTGDEFKAAVTLWGKAFLQVPAGSLPADERILAHLSGAGSSWRKVRDMALRGWIKASDGRLYHPVVAEKALHAWEARLAQRARTEAARQARAQRRQVPDIPAHMPPPRDEDDAIDISVTTSVTETVTGSKGQGQGQGQGFKENPLTPIAAAMGGPTKLSSGKKGLRSNGTSPRQLAAAAEAAKPPPPEPASSLWPAFKARGMGPAEFRRWIEPLTVVEAEPGRTAFAAPSAFHASHVRTEHALTLAAAAGGIVEIFGPPGGHG